MRHARLALRLEPCMARTQDVGQRGRTTIDVVLLHFLHYFLLLHPIFPAQKSAGASNAAAPNMRHARLALRFRPRNVTNRQSDTLVFCTFCIISCSSNPSFRHKKSTGASNAGAANMRHARLCLAASSLYVTNGRSGTLILLYFLHYSMSHPSNTEKAPRLYALARGSSGKTQTYDPSVNCRILCH